MDTVRSGEPLVAGYDGVVCDLDGVVYRGSDAVPEAAEALQDLVARGMKVVYATNNASRVPAEVAAQIAGLRGPRDGLGRRVERAGRCGAARRRPRAGSVGPRPGWRRRGRGPEGRRPRPRVPGWRCRRGCRRLCRAPGIRQAAARERLRVGSACVDDGAALGRHERRRDPAPAVGAVPRERRLRRPAGHRSGATPRRRRQAAPSALPPGAGPPRDAPGQDPRGRGPSGHRHRRRRGSRHRLGVGPDGRRPADRPRGRRGVPDVCPRLARRSSCSRMPLPSRTRTGGGAARPGSRTPTTGCTSSGGAGRPSRWCGPAWPRCCASATRDRTATSSAGTPRRSTGCSTTRHRRLPPSTR